MLSQKVLDIISSLDMGEKSGNNAGHMFRRFKDYRREMRAYGRLNKALCRLSKGDERGCYRCNLFPSSERGKFLSRETLKSLISEVCEWRGIELHPSASDNFLGGSVCIRCASAILIGPDPILSMRVSMKCDHGGII